MTVLIICIFIYWFLGRYLKESKEPDEDEGEIDLRPYMDMEMPEQDLYPNITTPNYDNISTDLDDWEEIDVR